MIGINLTSDIVENSSLNYFYDFRYIVNLFNVIITMRSNYFYCMYVIEQVLYECRLLSLNLDTQS